MAGGRVCGIREFHAPQLKDGDDGCSSADTNALMVNYAHLSHHRSRNTCSGGELRDAWRICSTVEIHLRRAGSVELSSNKCPTGSPSYRTTSNAMRTWTLIKSIGTRTDSACRTMRWGGCSWKVGRSDWRVAWWMKVCGCGGNIYSLRNGRNRRVCCNSKFPRDSMLHIA